MLSSRRVELNAGAGAFPSLTVSGGLATHLQTISTRRGLALPSYRPTSSPASGGRVELVCAVARNVLLFPEVPCRLVLGWGFGSFSAQCRLASRSAPR